MQVIRKNVGIAFLSIILFVLWQFPTVWYAGQADDSEYQWFGLNQEILGWTFTENPVGDAAEAILVADRMDNGTFQKDNKTVIRVFSAKRFEEKENAVGLFSHTPDRCWTNTGMVIENEPPYFRNVSIHGIDMILERRIFSAGAQRELVYFGALVGGEALPYRMDQYLGSGRRSDDGATGDEKGAIDRLLNSRVWTWALESFVERTRLAGPQQLIRISTPITESIDATDARLVEFLEQWLRVVPYEEERLLFEREKVEAE